MREVSLEYSKLVLIDLHPALTLSLSRIPTLVLGMANVCSVTQANLLGRRELKFERLRTFLNKKVLKKMDWEQQTTGKFEPSIGVVIYIDNVHHHVRCPLTLPWSKSWRGGYLRSLEVLHTLSICDVTLQVMAERQGYRITILRFYLFLIT